MTIKVYFFLLSAFLLTPSQQIDAKTWLNGATHGYETGQVAAVEIWILSLSLFSLCQFLPTRVFLCDPKQGESPLVMQQLPTFTFISLRVICLPEKLNFKTAQSALVGVM